MAESELDLEAFDNAMSSMFSKSAFKDSDFDQMSQLLSQIGKVQWSHRPRTYAVLRMIDRVDLMVDFVAEGAKDIALPYSMSRLPHALNTPTLRHRFLEKQESVLTKATDLEVAMGRHRHFSESADVHFDILERLGQGGYGEVHRVRSKLSREEYARMFSRDQAGVKTFENEIQNLKRLSHQHLVQLVGSYSDPKYICLLISPVADGDLGAFMNRSPFPREDFVLLRGFCGCLCSAISYLHNQKCRHKDLKPGNILIKGDTIFITDFGTARDWSDLSQSTTTGDSGAFTRLYAAPEVLAQRSRNSAADIWSLGCIFLDMMVVLHSKTLKERTTFFETHGNCGPSPGDNVEALNMWMDQMPGKEDDSQLFKWTRQTLVKEPKERPTAMALFEEITLSRWPHMYYSSCCNGFEESTDEEGGSSSGSNDIDISSNPSKSLEKAKTVQSLQQTSGDPSQAKSHTIVRRSDFSAEEMISQYLRDSYLLSPNNVQISIGKTLIWAVQTGEEKIADILIGKGADIEERDATENSPLFWAIFCDHEAVVKLLLKRGADVEAKNICGLRALHIAAFKGRYLICRHLLDSEADIEAKGGAVETPLHWAAYMGHAPIVKFLIERGARIDGKDRVSGWSALHWAAFGGHEAVVNILVTEGMNKETSSSAPQKTQARFQLMWRKCKNIREHINNSAMEASIADVPVPTTTSPQLLEKIRGEGLIHLVHQMELLYEVETESQQIPIFSAVLGNQDRIARQLVNDRSFTHKSQSQWTLLHYIAWTGNTAILKDFDQWVDINEIWASRILHPCLLTAAQLKRIDRLLVNTEFTHQRMITSDAVFIAAIRGHARMVRQLIRIGLEPNGQTLVAAVVLGRQDVVLLLLEEGVSFEEKRETWTVLSEAVDQGHLALVQILLEYGASGDIIDDHGETVLHLAARLGHEDIARLLLQNGASANMQNSRCLTPLHVAAYEGYYKIARLLLEEGALVDYVDMSESTALHCAAKRGHTATVQTLLDNGASVDAIDKDGKTALDLAAEGNHSAIVTILAKATEKPRGLSRTQQALGS
ncbi:MAG: hypothetical protein M1814_001077 [Vezdaea aestivalis]|nr:MAG: hypothetical protein M1814_001077 [Vezdaea aestivalis]